MKRRDFLTTAAYSSLGLAIGTYPTKLLGQTEDAPQPKHPVAIFTKVFQKHSFDQLGELLNQVAADGAEATLRSGGYVAPIAGDFETQVQRLVQVLAKHEQRVLIAARISMS